MLPSSEFPAYRVRSRPDIRVFVSELACCALEVGSAATSGLLVAETSDDAAARVNVVLVSGTVTALLAPAVLAQWARVPEPRLAIAVGACASSGGPYWDSPTVLPGLTAGDGLVMDGFIAGCPPSPQMIIDGLLALVPAP